MYISLHVKHALLIFRKVFGFFFSILSLKIFNPRFLEEILTTFSSSVVGKQCITGFSLFSDVNQLIFYLVADVLGRPIGSIFKSQDDTEMLSRNVGNYQSALRNIPEDLTLRRKLEITRYGTGVEILTLCWRNPSRRFTGRPKDGYGKRSFICIRHR